MDKYTTSDLGLASFLCVRGLNISSIDRVRNSEKVVLTFDDFEKCKKLHIEFFNSDSYKVLQEQKRLKSMILSAPKG